MTCPICKSLGAYWTSAQDIEYQTSNQTFDFFSCECGVLYMADPPLDQLSTIYPPDYYSYQTGRESIVSRVKNLLDVRSLRRLFRNVESPKISVLDVGGGTGRALELCRKADSRVSHGTVVDLSVPDDQTHSWIEYRRMRIEDFSSEQPFDVVLMFNLIEHLSDPKTILEKISENLSQNGFLVIQTPNWRSLDARMFRRANWGGLHTPRHWVLFDENSISRLLGDVGYQIESVKYVQGAPFWCVGICAALERRRLLRRKQTAIFSTWQFQALLPILAAFDIARARLGFKTSQQVVVARWTKTVKQNN